MRRNPESMRVEGTDKESVETVSRRGRAKKKGDGESAGGGGAREKGWVVWEDVH